MWSRRAFLARLGVLGAAATVPGGVWARAASADHHAGLPYDEVVQAVTGDTFAALAAFVCPGPDRYSVQQGETDPAPGGVDADGGGFLAHALDHYLPYPDAVLRPLAHALATATADEAGVPADLLGLADEVVRGVDGALTSLLANDQTVQASVPSALLLNHAATTVRPDALVGPFLASPFANLDMAGKAAVFEFLDTRAAPLVAQLDGGLDEPARAAVSGLVRFLSAALVHFTAFGIYSEWSTSRGRGDVVARPVGWDLASFTPGEMATADGWDELRGYWRGRRQNADDAPVFPRSARA